MQRLANALSAKIEDGNIRAAIRIVCSEDQPAQKTAYEISACLVGSEMCIRDRRTIEPHTTDHEIVSHKTKSTDAAILLANAVSAKIEDGNIRAAIRMFRRYAGTGQRARTTGRQAPCTSAGPWIRSRSTTDGGCRDDGRRGDPRSTLCSARISRRT